MAGTTGVPLGERTAIRVMHLGCDRHKRERWQMRWLKFAYPVTLRGVFRLAHGRFGHIVAAALPGPGGSGGGCSTERGGLEFLREGDVDGQFGAPCFGGVGYRQHLRRRHMAVGGDDVL